MTAGAVSAWYPSLRKPWFTPPNWLFGPAWTALYTMMAIAAWLVWRRVGFHRGRLPLGLYLSQLALNLVWSGLFFGLRNPLLGAIDISLLWTLIVATTAAFWRIHRAAGTMMLPYLCWVSYAAALNFAIYWLNLPGH